MSKANLILHPIRLRIVLALAGRQMTARQIAGALPDIAQATLYRHINALAKGGILEIVEERAVRGTSEKIYAVHKGAGRLSQDEMAQLSRDEHRRLFTTFVATLLGDFERYIERETFDLYADGVGYTQIPMYLTDAEFQELAMALNRVLAPYLANTPTPERRRRILTTVVLPVPDEHA